MEFLKNRSTTKNVLMTAAGGAMLLGGAAAFAGNGNGNNEKNYVLKGPCAYLPADRATEFHGNAAEADLLLGMAGNQWVVFDAVMQGFNDYRNGDPDGTSSEPAYHPNQVPAPTVDNPDAKADYWTLARLNEAERQYYIQLVPPGQIRKQIKSGCMTLGNDEERNFLTGSVQVDFDIFASTNYNLMKDLGKNGFVTEAIPYIKNKLDLMIGAGNPAGIGDGHAPGSYEYNAAIVLDLLSSGIRVSEVDHVNEGVHNAINKMYKAMDKYIRVNDPDTSTDGNGVTTVGATTAALDAALALVETPQANSPADNRFDTHGDAAGPGKFTLANNAHCHYWTDTDGDGAESASEHSDHGATALRFCEFAILNKSNTHETRVHHVETPDGILADDVDVGPVWTSELQYQFNRRVAVAGMNDGSKADPDGGADLSVSNGVPTPAGSDVNKPATYSIAVVATAEDESLAEDFIDYVRTAEGQAKYVDGGFIGLSAAEMAVGKCYSLDRSTDPATTAEWDRVGNSCD